MKIIPPPEFVSWESTLRCNFPCKHCGLSAGLVKYDELDTVEAISMMEEVRNLGTENLVISGGEFTLRSDWQRLLDYSLEIFSSVRIITNGHLGNRLLPKLLSLEHLDRFFLSVSLDGNQQSHDYRRCQGSFEKVRQILSQDTPFSKIVITTFGKDNYADRLDILHTCLQNKVSSWSVQLSLPAGRMPMSNVLEEEQIIELADFIKRWQDLVSTQLEIIVDDCFGYFHPMRQYLPWSGCPAGKRLMTILADGQVTGCPTMTGDSAGNIRQLSLDKIWAGQKMGLIRKELPAPCNNCVQCLGGCRAVQKTLHKQLCFK